MCALNGTKDDGKKMSRLSALSVWTANPGRTEEGGGDVVPRSNHHGNSASSV